MALVTLELTDFRHLRGPLLACSPGLNVVSGDNASGKTSLLEAVYLLGRGKSFRAARLEEAIRRGAEAWRVVAELDIDGRHPRLGIQRDASGFSARFAGEPVAGLATLARALPVLLLTPDSHRLLDGGPKQRRRLLDWGLFQADPAFIGHWRRYDLALRQRNAALRQGVAARGLAVWEAELAAAALPLDAARRGFCAALEARLGGYADALLDLGELRLDYHRGWHRERELAEVLAEGREVDRRFGHTRSGPHRADFGVRVGGRAVAESLSRGQHKLLVTALVLAQAALYRAHCGRACTLLIDDLPAELDRPHRARVMRCLAGVGAQVFVTAIEPASLDTEAWEAPARFHLDDGLITKLI
ncbi:DNA replication and repair protein RecF [Plasticicumulans lactativorans]|uniref:DNA replication and repair protein RecF n=1 Tax=Plasticicumulans lactativorans TaxID=1133106 RepID=A0A4R2L767_9GAMM|nr:DNA replication/repair protein RecF [Plasticicumulans lactativorans]TCO82787.1 DNA replication and repair protein RecF [Plasticicumulans lactativorans]